MWKRSGRRAVLLLAALVLSLAAAGCSTAGSPTAVAPRAACSRRAFSAKPAGARPSTALTCALNPVCTVVIGTETWTKTVRGWSRSRLRIVCS